MKSIRRTMNLPIVLLALGLFAVIAFQARAYRQGAGSPTVVVTVDISRVLQGLDERAVKEAEFLAMAEKILADDELKQSELEEMGRRFDEIPQSDRAARQAMRNNIDLRMLEFQGWRQFQAEKVDIEKSLLLRGLYKGIQEAIAELSRTEGYDLVLVDDSNEDIKLNPQLQVSRELQIKQQLSERRVLYANPSIDITNNVIARMNNAFNAG